MGIKENLLEILSKRAFIPAIEKRFSFLALWIRSAVLAPAMIASSPTRPKIDSRAAVRISTPRASAPSNTTLRKKSVESLLRLNH